MSQFSIMRLGSAGEIAGVNIAPPPERPTGSHWRAGRWPDWTVAGARARRIAAVPTAARRCTMDISTSGGSAAMDRAAIATRSPAGSIFSRESNSFVLSGGFCVIGQPKSVLGSRYHSFLSFRTRKRVFRGLPYERFVPRGGADRRESELPALKSVTQPARLWPIGCVFVQERGKSELIFARSGNAATRQAKRSGLPGIRTLATLP